MFERHNREGVTSRLRLRGHDYESPANYLVTICTQDRSCLFGEIHDESMILTPAGTVIESWWHSISNHFPAVVVDATVVMPNHVHGILMCGTMFDVVGSAPVPSLSRILQWFKGSSTNDYIRGVHTQSWPRFSGRLWQHGYHEHIIRSDEELERFRTYILDNPALWPQDEDNPGVVRCVGAVP